MIASAPAPMREMQFADWTHKMSRSVLRQLLAVTARPGVLSFAGGLPDPNLFPRADYAAALAQVLTDDKLSLQYGPPLPALRRHIVALMAQRGITCTEEQIFLTTGAQQGLDVLTRLLLNPGGSVILEKLVYTGLLQAVAPAQPHILSVPIDLQTGMDVTAVATYLADAHLEGREMPAFIYVVPDAGNPTGITLSLEKRQRLVLLAQEYGVPILEDDPYGFLAYDAGYPLPPLRSLNEDWVFYLGSFSKILAPALRLGWIVAPKELIPKLTVIKETEDLESSALTQRAVAAYLDTGCLRSHVAGLQREYGRRRDAMLAALSRHFPSTARWTRPKGGMFIWVELPTQIDTAVLLSTAVEEELVAFVPGYAFAVPGHPAPHSMRLNFSNCTPELIEEGIARLGRLISRVGEPQV